MHITGLSFFLDRKQPSFNKLWASFMKKQTGISGRIQPEQFCQYTAWMAPESSDKTECTDDSMMVVCAVETDSSAVQNPIFINRMISGGTFLHVIHPGSMDTSNKTYKDIYCRFIAESSYPFTSCWEYQKYNEDGSTGIFIPVG